MGRIEDGRVQVRGAAVLSGRTAQREGQMGIWITGDVHGAIDIAKLSHRRWPAGRSLTRDDVLIIAGDFGMPWDGSNEERYWLDWLEERPWTTLYVDGNHECYPYLEDLPVTERWGGKVQVYPDHPHIVHLMRGQVFDLPLTSAADARAPSAANDASQRGSVPARTLRVFAMGGAASHDKAWRTPGWSWFPEELPAPAEYAEAERNLAEAGWKVDLVVSHCCASRWLPALLSAGDRAGRDEPDALVTWFDELEERLAYRLWCFGHYHVDLMPDARHRALYRRVASWDELLAEGAARGAAAPRDGDATADDPVALPEGRPAHDA